MVWLIYPSLVVHGLMRPCRALPSLPLVHSAVVTSAGVSFRPSGFSAPFLFAVATRGPPPRLPLLAGAPAPLRRPPLASFRRGPSPAFSLARALRYASGFATLRESGSLRRAAVRNARLGFRLSAGMVATLPIAVSSPPSSVFLRLARCPLRVVFRLPAA